MKIQTKTREVSIWELLSSRELNETAIEPYDAFSICKKLNRLVTEMNPDIIIEFDSELCDSISADITMLYREEAWRGVVSIHVGKWENLKEFKKRIPKKLKKFLNVLDKKIIKL